MSSCDLHIHSRHSARSEEWLFRRFDFPDSYSDPKELHRAIAPTRDGLRDHYRSRHDRWLSGNCASASDLHQRASYDLFSARSLQASYFGVGHFGTAASRYRSVRDNIFDLQRYLQRAQIAHAVAHPLYSVNGKLEALHLEQLSCSSNILRVSMVCATRS